MRSVGAPCATLVPPSHTGDDRISEEEFALYFSKVMNLTLTLTLNQTQTQTLTLNLTLTLTLTLTLSKKPQP